MVITPTDHIADAQGEHDDREDRLAKYGPHCHALNDDAKCSNCNYRRWDGQPVGKAESGHQYEADEGADHHQLPLNEADCFSRFVDKHEAQSHQSVDTALRDSVDQLLQQLHLVSFLTWDAAYRTGSFSRLAMLLF